MLTCQKLSATAAITVIAAIGMPIPHGGAGSQQNRQTSSAEEPSWIGKSYFLMTDAEHEAAEAWSGDPVNLVRLHANATVSGHGSVATKNAWLDFDFAGKKEAEHLVVAVNDGPARGYDRPTAKVEHDKYVWGSAGKGTTVVALFRPGYSSPSGYMSRWTEHGPIPEGAEARVLHNALQELADRFGASHVTLVGFGPEGADAARKAGDLNPDGIRTIGVTGETALRSGRLAADGSREGMTDREIRHKAIMIEWNRKRHVVRQHPSGSKCS